MGVLYNAIQCPPVIVPTVAYTKAAAYAGSGPPPIASTISPVSSLTGPFNSNAMQLDLTARYGGGGYAVAKGLALSNGGGLNLNISAGHATIDGIAELAATVQAIPPNAQVWVWLTNAGAIVLTQGATALVAPSASCCLLGNCSTTLTAISAVDTSGVMVLAGGMMSRQTADIGAPGDTPPASARFYAITNGGLYLFNGATYVKLDNTVVGALALIADLQSQVDDLSALVRNIYQHNILNLDLEQRPEFEEQFELALAEGD